MGAMPQELVYCGVEAGAPQRHVESEKKSRKQTKIRHRAPEADEVARLGLQWTLTPGTTSICAACYRMLNDKR